jgi:sigma-E factor negative regulatory protein RseB
MRPKAAKAGLAAILLGLAPSLVASSSQSADEWLERMSAAMSQMSYQGTFVYVQGDDVETMRITHVADEAGVRERLVSVSGSQREILRDSNGIRWVQDEDHSVMEDPVSGRSFFPEISLQLSSDDASAYEFELGAVERIAGHSGRQVKIIPRDRYRYGYSLWLEEQSALLLKWELMDSRQRRLAKLMFTDLRLGSEVDTSELRSVRNLKDYRKLESKLPSGGSLSHSNPKWQATKLPPGFRLTAHRYLGKNSQQLYEHLVYSDGLVAVSVYVESSEEDPPNQDATISRMGTAHAYARVTDGVLITVVGDVPAVTVQTIGEAVQPKNR